MQGGVTQARMPDAPSNLYCTLFERADDDDVTAMTSWTYHAAIAPLYPLHSHAPGVQETSDTCCASYQTICKDWQLNALTTRFSARNEK